MLEYFKGWLNVLLLAFPALLVVEFMHGSAGVVFALACLSIIPLAGLMGHATEELAERAGAGIGGLLNATFGNAAEMIIAIAALHKGLVPIVKASLTGSIIGNLLFVMGLSLLAGGLKFKQLYFNRTAASAGIAMLLVAVIGLLVPAIYHWLIGKNVPAGNIPDIEKMSLWISGVLIVNYLCSLLFSLRTHPEHYNEEGGDAGAADREGYVDRAAGKPLHESAHKPLWMPIVMLLLATAAIAIASEALVGSLEPVMHRLGLRELFVGAVIIAIIGNAAEHSTAVMMAMRNKTELAMQICIGSSLQIALFVTPVLVFLSLVIGPHPMDLEFTTFEILAVLASVFVVMAISNDGESNWFEGVQLLSLYAILGAAFYFA
jgi:Ca2+:H+ antiporter